MSAVAVTKLCPLIVSNLKYHTESMTIYDYIVLLLCYLYLLFMYINYYYIYLLLLLN